MKWINGRFVFEHCYEIDFYDYETGATSPIDVVHTDDADYDAADYIKHTRENANSDYIDMVTSGKITVVKCY